MPALTAATAAAICSLVALGKFDRMILKLGEIHQPFGDRHARVRDATASVHATWTVSRPQRLVAVGSVMLSLRRIVAKAAFPLSLVTCPVA